MSCKAAFSAAYYASHILPVHEQVANRSWPDLKNAKTGLRKETESLARRPLPKRQQNGAAGHWLQEAEWSTHPTQSVPMW